MKRLDRHLKIPSRQTPVERTELTLVLAISLVAVALRCSFPSRVAVEHFDEGVYASDLWFGPEDNFRYPDQHLYAPPLLPQIIWWIFAFVGPSNVGAVIPSLLAGCATAPLVWWVGRSWFSRTAGLTAATLCALSDAHIALSRAALTDALLGFWLLLAVHLAWLAFTRASWAWAVSAGCVTGLAWWTKYNGWLPLAISLAGLLAWWLVARWRSSPAIPDLETPSQTTGRRSGGRHSEKATPDRTRDKTSTAGPSIRLPTALAQWCAMAAVAFALWTPWLVSLEDYGGYAAVAQNHRGYVVGPAGWFGSAAVQIRNLELLDGFGSLNAPLLALTLALYWSCTGSRRFTWNEILRSISTWLAVGLLVALPVMLGGHLVVALLGAWGVFLAVCFGPRAASSQVGQGLSLGAWMLCAWYVGLAAATPMYTPYPRLTLPWIMAGWLGAGVTFYDFVNFLGHMAAGEQPSLSRYLAPRSWVPHGVLLFGGLAFCLVFVFALEALALRPGFPGLAPRSGLAESAAAIVRAAFRDAGLDRHADRDQIVVYTFADPALVFQLRLAGVDNVRPISSLTFAESGAPQPKLPTFLVVGPQARRTAGFAERFARAQGRLEPVAEYDAGDGPRKYPSKWGSLESMGGFDFAPSDLVLLDNRERPPSAPDDPQRIYQMDLFRVR
ncbi:MAG: glycosyltransferase family 39 protein [Planctomycetaceae bacterium]